MRSALLLMAFCFCAQAQNSAPPKEQALGAAMASEVRHGATRIQDPEIDGYISDLATRLAGPSFLLTLELIDGDASPTHEPLALPAGYVFISAALLRTAQDEAEFAGMLAHALAHEMKRGNSRVSVAAGGGAIPKGMRPSEFEADATAARLMVEAGYDPEALARYLGRVNPTDSERLESLRKAIGELPVRTSSIVDSGRFQNIREKLTLRPVG